MHRLFVAIRPPENVRELLIDAMDDSPELRWLADEQLHLTLRFIGEVGRPLANDIADSLSAVRFPPFELRIAGVGRFCRRNGGALWAGIEPKKPVSELASKVDRACVRAGLDPERRAFHPHITLARWKAREPDAARFFERRWSALSSLPFVVNEFVLFESHMSRHGAHYEQAAICSLT